MKFTLSQIRKDTVHGPFPFSGSVDVSELEKMNNDIRHIKSVDIEGMCTLEKKTIYFDFTLKGNLILPCARTLVDVPYILQVDVTEIFSTADTYTKEDEENEIHHVTGEVIDLTPYIKEQIVLSLPYRVFSDEKMIDKGDGWSYYVEDDEQEKSEEKIDPRLAKLKLLLDERNDKNNK